MAVADGGVMTAEELTEGVHNIRGVQVIEDADRVLVRCPCGWTTKSHPRTQDAAGEWQLHRTRVV